MKVAAGSLQVPGSAVSVEPTIASPLTDGGVTTVGGACETTGPTRLESALPVPPAFVAVTSTSIWKPTSSPVSTYVLSLAPPIVVQLLPSP